MESLFSTDSMSSIHERDNSELLLSCLRVVLCGIQCSEMSSGHSNNRATRDAAIAVWR